MKISMVSLMLRVGSIIWWFFLIALFLLLPTAVNKIIPERSLTIFTWPLLLDPIYLKKFEQKTGIKLHIAYFENGPSLLSKFSATDGKGYDIIIPDDHSLQVLIEKKLVKKIDASKVPFISQIEPVLRNNYYDLDNHYSIPYYWGVYGIGYDASLFPEGLIAKDWQPLFVKPPFKGMRICMSDDPREAIMLAAYYLFGNLEALKEPANQQKVVALLIEQKKYVEVYTSSRSDVLLQNRSCGMASIMSPDIIRLQRETSSVRMAVPERGSFVVVDSIAISAATDKDAMIYAFLNYLYDAAVIEHHIQMFGYCSPFAQAQENQHEWCSAQRFAEFNFFKEIISDDQLNALWIEVLAA